MVARASSAILTAALLSLALPAIILTSCGSSPLNPGVVDAGSDGDVCSGLTCLDGGPCGGVSCEATQMCLDNACVAECSEVTNLCGTASEFCCTDQEACLQEACVELRGNCEFTEECNIGEICEPTLMRCIPRDAVSVCEFVPPPGVLSPQVACRWLPAATDAFPGSPAVVMTPSVMNLTDDNGDGATDAHDIPDIVFTSFANSDGCCTSKGVIRIVSGACNADGSMTTIATLGNGDPYIDNSGGIALGNLHAASNTAESAPEIVATMRPNGAVAYTRTSSDGTSWQEMWRNTSLPSMGPGGGAGAQPSLADLSGDGRPEVIIGNVVLDGLSGAVIWDGATTVGASAGKGNNAFLGPVSTIADLDLDGKPEVIAGNTVYDGVTGALKWTYPLPVISNTSCQPGYVCDGFNGVGNFDADPEGEVVIVRAGEVFVLNHDGSLLHRVLLPKDNCPRNESGPPTIADFDGDGRPEIGTAGADFYIVVDFDCTGSPLPSECEAENILWTKPNQDCSSRATGSSVFDFDGDGSAEVVYADETSFRVFDGITGNTIYEDTSHSSNTRLEMPIVVDVNNDGKSEIIVPQPNFADPARRGIEVWEDAANNWVRTRRVWNQHSYHVSNVSEDGQVPAYEAPNWSQPRLNNFRQNVQPDGLFDASDLEVAVADSACEASALQDVQLTVSNNGALGVGAGLDIFVEVLLDGVPVSTGLVQTTGPILPGQSEVVIFSFLQPPAGGSISLRSTVDSDGSGGSSYNECNEDNNQAVANFMRCQID